MTRRPQVIAVMTPFPWTVDTTASLEQAHRMMREHDVRHLPVTRNGELAGIIGLDDIAVATATARTEPGAAMTTIAALYRDEPYVVDVGTPLDEVLLTMAERHLDAALVTRYGKLAGIFTAVDACRAYGEYLQQRYAVSPNDSAA